MTLHDLTRTHGLAAVAIAIGRTSRALASLRSGDRPLTVDDLYRLTCAYPGFDVDATVARVGGKRNPDSPPPGPCPECGRSCRVAVGLP